MTSSFPFYSTEPETSGPGLYHTHPRCRIAQEIDISLRVLGTGSGRKECPFCFLLGQFQANRALRSHTLPPLGGEPSVHNVANRKSGHSR